MPAMLEAVGSSTSGSTRQRPLLESPYHMCRTGLPVNWLIAVPSRITPELGAVTEDKPKTDQSWVPAHNVVGWNPGLVGLRFVFSNRAQFRSDSGRHGY